MKRKIPKVLSAVKKFTVEFNNRNLSAFSAQAAFFLVVSIVPLCALALSVIRLADLLPLSITSTDIEIQAKQAIPSILQEVLSSAYSVSQNVSFAMMSASILVVFWIASQGLHAVYMGINSAYGLKTPSLKSGIFHRLLAMFDTLLFVLIVGLTFVVIACGNTLYANLAAEFPWLASFRFPIIALRFILTLTVLALYFVLLYKFIAVKRQTLRFAYPGALFSAVGWVAFSYFYSLYIDTMTKNGLGGFYGSLTAVVLLMLWLYSCMLITLAGGLLNTMIDDMRKERQARILAEKRTARKRIPSFKYRLPGCEVPEKPDNNKNE